MTYYWGRKSKNLFVNFMGLFIMRAPYLPWFYFALSFLLDSDLKADILGITVGHIIFYLRDIYPRLKLSCGRKPLKTPNFITNIANTLGLNNDVVEFVDEGEMMF